MKKIIVSLGMAAVLIMGVGAGTWALFSDTETSASNTFAAGTLELRVQDRDEYGPGWRDGVRVTWSMTNMKPGDAIYEWLGLTDQFGTVKGSALRVEATNVVVDPPGIASDTEEGTTDMDEYMEIVSCSYRDGWNFDCKAPIANSNGNTWIDLDDLESNPVTLPWDPGHSHWLEMELRFHPDADSDFQGDALYTDLTFTLLQ